MKRVDENLRLYEDRIRFNLSKNYPTLPVKRILKSKDCHEENNFKNDAQDQDQNVEIVFIQYLYGHHSPLHQRHLRMSYD